MVRRFTQHLEIALQAPRHDIDVDAAIRDVGQRCRHLREQPVVMKPGLTAMRRRIRVVALAKAAAMVQVSAKGALRSNSPFAKRVGIKRE